VRRTGTRDAAGRDEDAGRDADADDDIASSREAAMIALTTNSAATATIGMRRVFPGGDSRSVIQPVNGPSCCQPVSGSSYASDICQRGSIGPCVC
jgi:hypothetical protein